MSTPNTGKPTRSMKLSMPSIAVSYTHLIGDRTLIGPNCQLVTPNHPINYMERRKPVETGFPITIGEDGWLGAGVIVCQMCIRDSPRHKPY